MDYSPSVAFALDIRKLFAVYCYLTSYKNHYLPLCYIIKLWWCFNDDKVGVDFRNIILMTDN